MDDDESRDGYSRGRPGGFRPESAPTVLNMSPECSLSGPPSSRTNSELGHNEDMRGHMMHNGDDLSGKNPFKSLKHIASKASYVYFFRLFVDDF